MKTLVNWDTMPVDSEALVLILTALDRVPGCGAYMMLEIESAIDAEELYDFSTNTLTERGRSWLRENS